jgi:hypothetical protein
MGLVKINENAYLDRDIYGSLYTLKIVATDLGAPYKPLSTTTAALASVSPDQHTINGDDNVCYLMIEIVDVNNKKPEFSNNLQ